MKVKDGIYVNAGPANSACTRVFGVVLALVALTLEHRPCRVGFSSTHQRILVPKRKKYVNIG